MGQAKFTEEAIKSGVPGRTEAHRIMAGTDHEKAGGMYLRTNQRRSGHNIYEHTCILDASVANHVHAKCTWRPGHDLYTHICILAASVATYVRATYTWRSGQYFDDPI